jgi:ribosomal protein S18 acetylase RimI-like enzyme
MLEKLKIYGFCLNAPKKQILINMNLEFAKKDDAMSVFALLIRCRDSLIEQGIFQWDKDYPDPDCVKNDINNGSLAKLTDSGRLLGVISFDNSQEPEYKTVNWKISCESIAVIHRLAVDPKFQGKGYGGKLMNFAENSISESGFKAIRLIAFSGNKMLAVFYKKLGYKMAGEIFFPGINLPFICMEKAVKTN